MGHSKKCASHDPGLGPQSPLANWAGSAAREETKHGLQTKNRRNLCVCVCVCARVSGSLPITRLKSPVMLARRCNAKPSGWEYLWLICHGDFDARSNHGRTSFIAQIEPIFPIVMGRDCNFRYEDLLLVGKGNRILVRRKAITETHLWNIYARNGSTAFPPRLPWCHFPLSASSLFLPCNPEKVLNNVQYPVFAMQFDFHPVTNLVRCCSTWGEIKMRCQICNDVGEAVTTSQLTCFVEIAVNAKMFQLFLPCSRIKRNVCFEFQSTRWHFKLISFSPKRLQMS